MECLLISFANDTRLWWDQLTNLRGWSAIQTGWGNGPAGTSTWNSIRINKKFCTEKERMTCNSTVWGNSAEQRRGAGSNLHISQQHARQQRESTAWQAAWKLRDVITPLYSALIRPHLQPRSVWGPPVQERHLPSETGSAEATRWRTRALGLCGEAEGTGPGQCENKMADPAEPMGGQQKGGNEVLTVVKMTNNRHAMEQEKLRLDI